MIGDHLRKRRLDLGLTQAEAGERIGVRESTISNWERKRAEPEFRHWPGIIRFLGYNPLPGPTCIAELIPFAQRILGLSLVELAEKMATNESCLRRWQEGKSHPSRSSRVRLRTLATEVGAEFEW